MKLLITDLSKIKITEVKDWVIYFSYNGEKYLLHGSSDGFDASVTLYKRLSIDDNKGKYKLEVIESMPSSSVYIRNEYIRYFGLDRNNTVSYSNIDKEYFIKKLSYNGFANNIYDDLLKKKNNAIKDINKQIKDHQYQIDILKQKRRKLLEFNKE